MKYNKKILINKIDKITYIYNNMLIIEIKKGESLDKALKRYKYKVIKTKQLEQVRKKQEFVKKSVKKRDQLKKAKYIQYLKQKNMD